VLINSPLGDKRHPGCRAVKSAHTATGVLPNQFEQPFGRNNAMEKQL
jgi:hypothetical protein